MWTCVERYLLTTEVLCSAGTDFKFTVYSEVLNATRQQIPHQHKRVPCRSVLVLITAGSAVTWAACWCKSEEEELVWQLDGRLRVQVLTRQVRQFVGVLAGRRDSDSAGPVPVQMAHLESQPVVGQKRQVKRVLAPNKQTGSNIYSLVVFELNRWTLWSPCWLNLHSTWESKLLNYLK